MAATLSIALQPKPPPSLASWESAASPAGGREVTAASTVGVAGEEGQVGVPTGTKEAKSETQGPGAAAAGVVWATVVMVVAAETAAKGVRGSSTVAAAGAVGLAGQARLAPAHRSTCRPSSPL